MSVGLHPRDMHRLNELLQRLRDNGNTVIVVEHDTDVISAADHVIDVGPNAGRKGRENVFEGSYDDLLKTNTLIGRHLKDKSPIKVAFRTPTVAQVIEYFDLKEIAQKLAALNDVGLDYLSLGQPLSSLSGGECQRLNLANELHKKGSIYVLNEPTTGLHMSDISILHAIIDRLVEAQNTVIAIEYNQEAIRQADWIIDLGPEVGNAGGKIMFEGTPVELVKSKTALIAQYL
jgi:excinuclease UvrABC ATPase subunit